MIKKWLWNSYMTGLPIANTFDFYRTFTCDVVTVLFKLHPETAVVSMQQSMI